MPIRPENKKRTEAELPEKVDFVQLYGNFSQVIRVWNIKTRTETL